MTNFFNSTTKLAKFAAEEHLTGLSTYQMFRTDDAEAQADHYEMLNKSILFLQLNYF